MSNPQKISQRLQELSDFIESAHTSLGEGEVVNLSHLDGEIEQLCNAALRLPPADAKEVQPVMADMISKLEALGLALQEFQNGLKSQQQGLE
jgi:urease accessory protein UreF